MFDMDQDYFDSRDVIERIEELESMEELFLDPESSEEDKAEWTRELDSELSQLRAFVDSVGSSEFNDGMTFIADSHLAEYAEELCTDLGYLPRNLPGFISSNIDWAGVAYDLRFDYSEYELDGNTYYARD